MVFYKKLNEFQETFFDIFINISFFLIIVSFFGLSNIAPKFLDTLEYYIRIYICLFLIWRFNPFRHINKFTDLDRKIAFNAGMFIITTTALNQYLVNIKGDVQNIIVPNKN
jgi:hypothetical protein